MNFSGKKATSVNKNFGLRFINEENLTKQNKFYNQTNNNSINDARIQHQNKIPSLYSS